MTSYARSSSGKSLLLRELGRLTDLASSRNKKVIMVKGMKKTIPLSVAGCVLLSFGLAQAEQIVKPHSFTNGTPALAEEVNADFDTVYGQVNKVGAAITVDGINNVGIGTTTPAKALQVIGDIRVGTSSTNGCLENFAGTALVGTCASDERLKTNITPIGNTLTKLSLLTPSTFYWNDIAGTELQNSTTTQNYGLIAQNVAQIFPDMVATTSNGYLGVNYSMLPILTLQGLQDLNLNLESIASSTAPLSDTTDTRTFAGRFFDRLTEWFADAGNGIGDFIANRVHTKTLCVGDSTEGETCITKSELDQLLQNNQVAGVGSVNTVSSAEETIVEVSPVVSTATTSDAVTDLAPEEMAETIEISTPASSEEESTIDAPVDLEPLVSDL